MKRLFSLLIAAALAVSLAACGSSASSAAATPAPTAEPTQAPTEETAPAESETTETADSTAETTTDGKTLVVYYSATGNTEHVARLIADATGADLFEVEAAEPYTAADLNYSDKNSRVSRQHDDESLRDVALVSTEVPDWDSYDTVFIGYPIWWGGAAWPLNGFVTANDFTGKTVIPFAIAASSGMGDSGTDLAKLAGTGNWLDGQRFFSSTTIDDIQSWLDTLGL
ncbi:flavodoxin [Gemmiger sp.]